MHTLVTYPVPKMGLLRVLLFNGILKECWTRGFCIFLTILDDFFTGAMKKEQLLPEKLIRGIRFVTTVSMPIEFSIFQVLQNA